MTLEAESRKLPEESFYGEGVGEDVSDLYEAGSASEEAEDESVLGEETSEAQAEEAVETEEGASETGEEGEAPEQAPEETPTEEPTVEASVEERPVLTTEQDALMAYLNQAAKERIEARKVTIQAPDFSISEKLSEEEKSELAQGNLDVIESYVSRVASKAAQLARQQTLREFVPVIDQQLNLRTRLSAFYAKNRDLIPLMDVVNEEGMKIDDAGEGGTLEETLSKAAEVVRKRLNIKPVAKQESQKEIIRRRAESQKAAARFAKPTNQKTTQTLPPKDKPKGLTAEILDLYGDR